MKVDASQQNADPTKQSKAKELVLVAGIKIKTAQEGQAAENDGNNGHPAKLGRGTTTCLRCAAVRTMGRAVVNLFAAAAAEDHRQFISPS